MVSGLNVELGADVEICKRGALLHDIGKAVDFERDGTHASIGAEIARKLGERKEVVNAVAAHHEDVEMETVEAVIVQVADALSAARPGARRETIDTYVKRLEKLESLAESFNGVEKCFAIQAAANADHGPARRDRRPGRGQTGLRNLQENRRGIGIPRPHQGDHHPGNPFGRLCPVT